MVCFVFVCFLLDGGRVGRDSFLVLVFATTLGEMPLWSVLLIRIGKQNVKIIDKLVEIEKCKNELFKMS